VQLYKISFRAQKGDVVETGVFLACANSVPDAEAMVAVFTNNPPALTAFETHRIKPSLFELSRSDFRLSEVAAQIANKGPDDGKGAVHEVSASAKVFGYSESSVVRRFAKALIENASAANSQPGKHVNEMALTIERADHRPRLSRVEEQSIYKEKRFFSGGSARPR